MSDDFSMEIVESLVMIPGPVRTWYAMCPAHAWTSPDHRTTRGEAVIDFSRHLRDEHKPRPKETST